MSADLVIMAVPGPMGYEDGDVIDVYTEARKARRYSEVWLRHRLEEQHQRGRRRPASRLTERDRTLEAGGPYPAEPAWCKRWLWILVHDLTPADVGWILEPLDDEAARSDPEAEPGVMLKKRARYIDWRTLEGMTAELIAAIEDPTVVCDPRDVLPVYDARDIVREKVQPRG